MSKFLSAYIETVSLFYYRFFKDYFNRFFKLLIINYIFFSLSFFEESGLSLFFFWLLAAGFVKRFFEEAEDTESLFFEGLSFFDFFGFEKFLCFFEALFFLFFLRAFKSRPFQRASAPRGRRTPLRLMLVLKMR